MTKSTIFVFGSNESGIHGAGAAKFAVMERGARYGVGFGHHGNSFAIPTKDIYIQTLPLIKIRYYVDCFILYATYYRDYQFLITRIGCGLAGYEDDDIAPMFTNISDNCIMPIQWKDYLTSKQSMCAFHDEGKLL